MNFHKVNTSGIASTQIKKENIISTPEVPFVSIPFRSLLLPEGNHYLDLSVY